MIECEKFKPDLPAQKVILNFHILPPKTPSLWMVQDCCLFPVLQLNLWWTPPQSYQNSDNGLKEFSQITWYDHFRIICSILFLSTVSISFPSDSLALLSSISISSTPSTQYVFEADCLEFLVTWGKGRSVFPLMCPLIWYTVVASSWTCLEMSGNNITLEK